MQPDPLKLIQQYRDRFVGSTSEQIVMDACENEIQQLRLTIRVLEQSSQQLLEYNNKLKRHLRRTQEIALDFMCRQDEELGLL